MTEFSQDTDTFGKGSHVVYPTDVAYGTTTDPAFTVHELLVFTVATGKEIDLTLASGDTISGIEPRGNAFTLNFAAIDSFTVRDPAASGGDTVILALGE